MARTSQTTVLALSILHFVVLGTSGCAASIGGDDLADGDASLAVGGTTTKSGCVDAAGTRSRRYYVFADDDGTLVFNLRWQGSANLDLRLFDSDGNRVASAE